MGLDYSIVPIKVTRKALFIDEIFDVENVINGVVSKKKWKHDMSKATLFKFYDKENVEPWIVAKKSI